MCMTCSMWLFLNVSIDGISLPCMILGLWFLLGKLGMFRLKQAYGKCTVY